MDGKRLACQECGTEYRGDDVNLQTGLARCRSCDRVYRVGGAGATPPPKAPVAQPASIQMRTEGGEVVFERRWYHPAAFVILFFTVFWSLITGFFVISEIRTGKVLFPLIFPHFYVALFLIYFTLCFFLNKTSFLLSPGTLKIRVRPLPLFGNRDIPVDEIDQLFCEKVVGNKGAVNYRLILVKKDGKRVHIGGTSQNRDEVIYLEQQLEAALGIEDRWVEGEHGNEAPRPSFAETIRTVSELFRKK